MDREFTLAAVAEIPLSHQEVLYPVLRTLCADQGHSICEISVLLQEAPALTVADNAAHSAAQAEAEAAMLDTNADMSAHMHEHPLWEKITLQPGAHSTTPPSMYLSHALGRVRSNHPGIAPQVHGGILAEEMGLGVFLLKTV